MDDFPLAEQHAQAAVKGFRDNGNRGGEAQALLSLGDLELGLEGGHLVNARTDIESAQTILESLGYEYGQARVYQYLGTVTGDMGDIAQSARFFEETLNRGLQKGNHQIQALELMNL